MNIKAVFKAIGPVLITIGCAMGVSACVSLIYHEDPRPLLIGAVVGCGSGVILWAWLKNENMEVLTIKEGCAIVTFAWILACLIGAIPLFLLGTMVDAAYSLTFTKAFYEIVSGFTTTGASILSDVEIIPKGILFWRSFTHWFGGMGIVVLAIAILPKLGVGGMRAFQMESPGPLKADKLVPRISETAKILYTVYLAITGAVVLLLHLVGVSWFDSFVHAFGTVGTGGFSSYNASVAGLHNVAAEYIIGFFMWLSGANFALTYYAIWKGKIKNVWTDIEFRVYTGITLGAIALITVSLYWHHFDDWSPLTAFRYAFFQVPTILTTTGFATFDYLKWPPFAIGILVVLMFIGGSSGSTGGGLKVIRHIINFKFIKQEIIKIVRPNIISTIKLGNRPIDTAIVSSVMGLTILYLLVFGVGTLLLTAFNLDFDTAFSASIANLGNIGPGLGMVGPAGNYAAMPPAALWILLIEMLLGRLEVFTMLALVIPRVWRR